MSQPQPQSQPQFPTQRKSTPLSQLKKPQPAQMQQPIMPTQNQPQSQPQPQQQALPTMMQPAPPMRPQVQQPPQPQFQPQAQPQVQQQIADPYVAEQAIHQDQQIPEDAFELYNNIDSEVLAPQPIPYQVKQDIVVQSMCNPDDLQMFAIITIVFLVVSLLPIGSLVEKYVAIDKIPHGADIIKALIAGVVVFLIIKLMRA